jgi:peptide/nickel transport system ATP-binding protein
LICDESVSALDVSVQAQVLNLLNGIKKNRDLSMIFISHDPDVINYMCDRVMILASKH